MVVEWNREEGGPSVLLACPHHQTLPPPFFKVFTVFAISTDSAAFSEPIYGSIMLFCALLARLVCAFSTESFTFQVLPHTPKREANSCYECIFTPPVVLLWTLASSSAAPGCGTSFPLHCTTRCLQLRATPLRLCHTARAKEPHSSLCNFERSGFAMGDLTEGLSTASCAFSHAFIDAKQQV